MAQFEQTYTIRMPWTINGTVWGESYSDAWDYKWYNLSGAPNAGYLDHKQYSLSKQNIIPANLDYKWVQF